MHPYGSWVLACVILLGFAQRAGAEPLHADGKYLRDTRNAVVVLRGLNVAGDSKVPNFRPLDDPKLLRAFPDWGINVARLLFTWEAYEPQPGEYDESYLDYYVGVLDTLQALSVHAIVDFHQDGFSRFTFDGCGEGMPEWTIPANIARSQPRNDASCEMWGVALFADALLAGDVTQCWRGFYADQKPAGSLLGVRAAFLAMIGRVAARVRTHPAVVGYDILNEPLGDEQKDLAPLYTDAAKALRDQDPDAVLFISPQVFTSSGGDTELPAMTFENYVYAPHYYDSGLVIGHNWDGTSPKAAVDQMVARAASWRVPVFIAEFGGPAAAAGVSDYLAAFYQELDDGLLSGAQWTFSAHWDPVKNDGWNLEDFSIVDDQLHTRANFRVRPYVARIPGTPGDYTLKPEPYDIQIEWTHDLNAGALRIFAPKNSVFATGAFVTNEGDVMCAYEADERHIQCESPSEGRKTLHVRACADGEACLETARDKPLTDAGGDASAPPSHLAASDAGVASDAATAGDAADSSLPQQYDAGAGSSASATGSGGAIHAAAPAPDRSSGGCGVARGPTTGALGYAALASLVFALARRRQR